jgi:hypothetical protein
MEFEEMQLGAHGGGIPPGWDFPEARAAAAMGLDLWLLDSAMKQTPAERLEAATSGARSLAMLRAAGEQTDAA